jgi:putative endonuclease
MSKENLCLGKSGEQAAVNFLKKQGYKILGCNYRSELGEIDIIASDKDTICFIEVKTRHSDRFGSPFEAISKSKQRQISKAALKFLKENRLLDKRARFDVVSVMYIDEIPKLDLIKDAFPLAEGFTY